MSKNYAVVEIYLINVKKPICTVGIPNEAVLTDLKNQLKAEQIINFGQVTFSRVRFSHFFVKYR